jgi:hypothetical protein
MSVRRLIAMLKIIVSADESRFRNELTPENALQKLQEYNNNRNIINYARRTDAPKNSEEWLLDSFQFAASIIAESDILDMARYMNVSEVFKLVAPKFYGSSKLYDIVANLADRCPHDKRLRLMQALEENGHLQGIMRENPWARADAPSMFFGIIGEGRSVEDMKIVLKRSRAFQIAKRDQHFVLETIDTYPAFKDLL